MGLSQFFIMDSHGIYVWSTYGITLLIFAINIWITFREKQRVKGIILEYLASPSKTMSHSLMTHTVNEFTSASRSASHES